MRGDHCQHDSCSGTELATLGMKGRCVFLNFHAQKRQKPCPCWLFGWLFFSPPDVFPGAGRCTDAFLTSGWCFVCFFFFFCCRCETAQITQLLWHHVVTISSEWIIPSKETWRRGEEVGGSDLLVMKNWNNKGAEVLNKEMRATACRDLLLLFWEHTQVYRETLTNRVVHLPARLLKSNEGVKGESLDEALRGGSK